MKIGELTTGVQHIGIPTTKFEETVKFYHDLGFTTVHENYVAAKNQRVAFLQLHTLQLEVYEEPVIAGKAGAVDHIAIDCTDIEAAYKIAQESGLKIVSDGIEGLAFWKKGIRFFIIEGINCEKVEFCQIL